MGIRDKRRGPARHSPNWIRRRSVLWLAASALVVGGIALAALSAVDAAEPERASTSRVTRTEAMRTIPLDKLPPEARPKVVAVLNDTSLFRRLPVQVVDC